MTFEVDEHLNFTISAHHGDALPLDLSSRTVLSQDPACPDNSPLAADGCIGARVFVNRDGSPADPATPVIDQGSAVPVAVPIDQAPNGALVQVATATGEAFRSSTCLPGTVDQP